MKICQYQWGGHSLPLSFIQVNTIPTMCTEFIHMSVSLFYAFLNLSINRLVNKNTKIQTTVAIKPWYTTGCEKSHPRAKIARRDSVEKVRGRKKLIYFSTICIASTGQHIPDLQRTHISDQNKTCTNLTKLNVLFCNRQLFSISGIKCKVWNKMWQSYFLLTDNRCAS